MSALRAMPKGGGTITTLSTNSDFPGSSARLVVAGGFAYWLGLGTNLNRLATNVTTPTAPSTIALGQGAYDFALDATAIFFTVDATPGAQGSVWSVPLSTGTAAKLTDTSSGARPIAINSSTVYWGQNASIGKIGRTGGSSAIVANEGTQVLVADDTFVFWTEGGKVFRAPK